MKLKTFFIGLFLILIGFLVLGIVWLKSVYFIFISLNKDLKWKVDKRARIEFARSLSEIAYPGWHLARRGTPSGSARGGILFPPLERVHWAGSLRRWSYWAE